MWRIFELFKEIHCSLFGVSFWILLAMSYDGLEGYWCIIKSRGSRHGCTVGALLDNLFSLVEGTEVDTLILLYHLVFKFNSTLSHFTN